MKFIAILLLVGLIAFAGVQLKQLILVIKERKKKNASVSDASDNNANEHEKGKIS
ncbi:MAG: hypothetical protein IJA23_00385 [Clostridia bacterium]|nr:hypothetical protein [Clostridia bacterium]